MRRTAATSWSCPAGAANSAALLLKSASDQPPQRAGQRVRRRGPPLHGPHQLGRHRDLADARTRRSSRRRSASTTTTGAPRTSELPLGHIQMLGKCDQQHPAGRRALVRAEPGAGLHGQARDRLLADDGGPAAPGQPGHGRPPGPDPSVQDLLQPRAPQAAAGQAQGPARPARLPRDDDPALVGARPADPAGRHRAPCAAPCASATTRRRRRSTSTAARTTSTTSTSSTRASSRPASAVNPALTAMANALRVGDHLLERLGARRRASADCGRRTSARRWSVMKRLRRARRAASAKGLVAGFAGTAAMTCRARSRRSCAAARSARRPPARRPRCSASSEFEDDVAQARFSDLSHWGYGTGWGVVRGLLDARPDCRRASAAAAHGAAVWGSAQVMLPALEVAPAVGLLEARGDRDRRLPPRGLRGRDGHRLRTGSATARAPTAPTEPHGHAPAPVGRQAAGTALLVLACHVGDRLRPGRRLAARRAVGVPGPSHYRHPGREYRRPDRRLSARAPLRRPPEPGDHAGVLGHADALRVGRRRVYRRPARRAVAGGIVFRWLWGSVALSVDGAGRPTRRSAREWPSAWRPQ